MDIEEKCLKVNFDKAREKSLRKCVAKNGDAGRALLVKGFMSSWMGLDFMFGVMENHDELTKISNLVRF